MHRVGQRAARLGERPGGEEFEQHRQVVGQVGTRRLEAAGAIGLQEIDHRAAALAALAVDVLEEVERQ